MLTTEGMNIHQALLIPAIYWTCFSRDQEKAILQFRYFMSEGTQEICLDDVVKRKKTDNEVKLEIEAILNGLTISTLHNMERSRRSELIKQIKCIQGATQRQIARVTGLSQNIIFKT